MSRASAVPAVAVLAMAPVLLPGPAFAQTEDCALGLAKTTPPCIPPGQARQGISTTERRYRSRTGDVPGRDEVIFLNDYPRLDLPQLFFGQRDPVLDDRVMVNDANTQRILGLIGLFNALAD